ncbi:MAG: ParB-like protein [Xanthobacteraceae bacterium]
MHMIREPLLTTVAITDLRPTQITVGMREVMAKRKRWRETGTTKGRKFLGKHMIPVILGPKRRHFVIDHHHLALALHEEGVSDLAVTVVANLSRLESDEFWTVMDNHGWMHPFDAKGRRRHYGDIPKSVTAMVDDPYRSLAGELRRVGGFAKDTMPFSEFVWADFLRRRVKQRMVEQDFDRAMEMALKLAKSSDADYLPGWCGPVPDDDR